MRSLGRFHTISVAFLVLALTACIGAVTEPAIPKTPADVADATVLDERAAISVEIAYQAAAQVVIFAAQAGMIPADRKSDVLAAEELAYGAVLAVRIAYEAGNSTGYLAAVDRAQTAIRQFLALATGGHLADTKTNLGDDPAGGVRAPGVQIAI